MATKILHHYFKTTTEWRDWLLKNHDTNAGIYLILYKIDTGIQSMRWEEAVKVALCFGWIDSTVKSLGDGKRQQYFCPRKDKSIWSALNKKYIKELTEQKLMHPSGEKKIETAKKNGSWTALDDVENLIIPNDLQIRFNQNLIAHTNYQNFAKSYKKGYLYWLYQAKREATRLKRIEIIIQLCQANKKEK
ncbi:YdeI/OmpD-associated family protein [uncultured Tenacibaculum sp.]|uniref:YdeI/OmpD-associated family protein n=1 Tax=uncultured Tenacibaculum sp. TaxID=174713 RepID=UPI0026356AE3|nr:YdeI/OmpD-associated family protein [uncultured Tenacibaculum sp.]